MTRLVLVIVTAAAFVLVGCSACLAANTPATDATKPQNPPNPQIKQEEEFSNRPTVLLASELAQVGTEVELLQYKRGALQPIVKQLQSAKEEFEAAKQLSPTDLQLLSSSFAELRAWSRTAPKPAAPPAKPPKKPGPSEVPSTVDAATVKNRESETQVVLVRRIDGYLQRMVNAKTEAVSDYQIQLNSLDNQLQIVDSLSSSSIIPQAPLPRTRFARQGGAVPTPDFSSSPKELSSAALKRPSFAPYSPQLDAVLQAVLDGQPVDDAEYKGVAETQLKDLDAALDAKIILPALTARAARIKTDLDNASKDLEGEFKSKEAYRAKLEKELKTRDDYTNQLKINWWLVFAVFGMIVAIVLLFVMLRFLSDDLALLIVRERVLIEVVSMGFLLLTVIILGTAKLLQAEGLAALLGTIAGYIFARKAAELMQQRMLDDGALPRHASDVARKEAEAGKKAGLAVSARRVADHAENEAKDARAKADRLKPTAGGAWTEEWRRAEKVALDKEGAASQKKREAEEMAADAERAGEEVAKARQTAGQTKPAAPEPQPEA
jgi:hypothetical protein